MLASGIAHEIKNPLVAVKTFAQLLPRRQGDERFVADFGRVVGREIAKIERLLDRLCVLSRPGERPHRPIDVRVPMTDAIEAMRPVFAEKSIVLSSAMGHVPITVLGDHAELEGLFVNPDERPRGHGAAGMVRVEAATTADRVMVAVVDTGPGVPAEPWSGSSNPSSPPRSAAPAWSRHLRLHRSDARRPHQSDQPRSGRRRLHRRFSRAASATLPVSA
jgi:signal transduction histidine kinase